jgi:hypothetical protein
MRIPEKWLIRHSENDLKIWIWKTKQNELDKGEMEQL